ncbi:MAG: pyridoxal-phosphate dependent enzyme [Chromatiales bacterium]|nr:MAG: pyridoxal-phosphate dependent enzyme [Chromatiales bacterium]
MSDHLGNAYPGLARHVRKRSFASLPTPVSRHGIEYASGTQTVLVKHDDRTSPIYGGNKVRKLEYIFQRAKDRGAERVATFGTVGSNHALATAIFAKQFGLGCTCFLAHQKPTANIPAVLDAHLALGTELVRVGGGVNRLEVYRRYLQNRRTWVIPLGGSCWLGAVGFVNAGMELAAQIEAGELETPDRIYIANGTMGSVAGLALGLALAGLPTQLHAVRVTDPRYANREGMSRLMSKTATLLHRFDPTFPADLAARSSIVWRDDFFAGGYAQADEVTRRAVDFAKGNLDLTIETTYTGKAIAALLHDLENGSAGRSNLFWNTFNSRPLPTPKTGVHSLQALPESFERYYETTA